MKLLRIIRFEVWNFGQYLILVFCLFMIVMGKLLNGEICVH